MTDVFPSFIAKDQSKTSMLESLFDKVACLRPATLLKKKL